jgi:DNA polymerase-1
LEKVLRTLQHKQQEPRILAHFTQEEALVQAYKDGKDLYATAAAELYGKTVEECGDGSQERKNMKFGILSVMYSTGPKTLASQIGTTEKVAKAFIDAFYAKYQKVGKWIEANNEFTAKNGYIEMLYGRKRRLADINSRDKWTRIKTERKVTNARIQGSAAIQTKLTMIAIYEWCLAHGYEMLFSIHDEIAVLVPETISREKIEEFNDIMINTVKLSITNKSDVEISRRWAEGMSVDQYLTGVVNRDDFTKEKDYLSQKQIVENAWQEAIAN